MFRQKDAEKSEQTLDTEKKLSFTYDLAYHTQWMSKGFSLYGDTGAWMNTMVVDLWQSGFGAAVRYIMPGSGGYVKKERLDYTLFYGSRFFEDGPCKTKCKLSWSYKDWFRNHDQKTDLHQFILSTCLPDIFAATVYPRYTVEYLTAAHSDNDNVHKGGWVHNVGICYDWQIAGLDNQKVVLDAIATYNDGIGAKGHAWNHATFSATTQWKLNKNISLVPSLNYQLAMDAMQDAVEDTLYAKMSFRVKF